jgi:hypothetical protein
LRHMDPWQNLNISLFLIGCEASPFPCPFITRDGAMKKNVNFYTALWILPVCPIR